MVCRTVLAFLNYFVNGTWICCFFLKVIAALLLVLYFEILKGSQTFSPWQIGTLQYLEIEMKKWPSRDKRGQIGPNRTKWGQPGLNGAKQGKQGQTGPNRPNAAKRRQMRPNGVKQGRFFACRHIFMKGKIMFNNPGPQTKIGRAIGILLISEGLTGQMWPNGAK